MMEAPLKVRKMKMAAILKKPKMLLTPVNPSKNLAQTLLFPSIYSFAAKPKPINYPKFSFSVICSQSQQKYPPFDSLLNSYRKEEVRFTIKDKTQFTVVYQRLIFI
ncbi:hypothetical protein ES288_A06G038800v1 [Gossypium darwinii]|uniref:Uncharacterized protein n=1 Tax=Gossypium darwinii TaxID=34276 RepID=A0A5D2G1M0_GOSDA|nr:hypothetical protein ES288_A06G038800v1 [Gossypium darwinii]